MADEFPNNNLTILTFNLNWELWRRALFIRHATAVFKDCQTTGYVLARIFVCGASSGFLELIRFVYAQAHARSC